MYPVKVVIAILCCICFTWPTQTMYSSEHDALVGNLQTLHIQLDTMVCNYQSGKQNVHDTAQEAFDLRGALMDAVGSIQWVTISSDRTLEVQRAFFVKHTDVLCRARPEKSLKNLELLVQEALANQAATCEKDHWKVLLDYTANSSITTILWKSMNTDMGSECQKMLLEQGASPIVVQYDFEYVRKTKSYALTKGEDSLVSKAMRFKHRPLMSLALKYDADNVEKKSFMVDIPLPQKNGLVNESIGVEMNLLTAAFFNITHTTSEESNAAWHAIIDQLLERGARISPDPRVLWLPHFLGTIASSKKRFSQELTILQRALEQNPNEKQLKLGLAIAQHHVHSLQRRTSSDWMNVEELLTDALKKIKTPQDI